MKLLISCLLALAVFARAEAPKFDLRDGDRVLLLGDALLERENTLGYLEARMHAAFPDVKFTVRNLSWAGDTPKGWSRASFDAPAKGYERLKEQIALVKPTVVFLGYGMAASLQELTDTSGDILLNRDPARYGEEPMSAARFKKELGELMTDIEAVGEKPRFVLLSPIRHEDLRKTRPGMVDPARHNELLVRYTKGIEELADERKAKFVNLYEGTTTAEEFANMPGNIMDLHTTDNGIHINYVGGQQIESITASVLGWVAVAKSAAEQKRMEEESIKSEGWHDNLREAILRKNDLFFHRTRPANSTYLFGFRKQEQGRNAVEIPQFDPLVEKADLEIDVLKRGKAKSIEKPALSSSGNAAKSLPLPLFSVQEGYEITLWADTPLVGKPVGMNWDAAGRLWVACSPVYPQIAPGDHPEDKVVVIEDTDRDGKADKSTTFATNLLIAAGVAPDFGGVGSGQSAVGSRQSDGGGNAKLPTANRQLPTINAAYVGSSTELVHVTDTDGDGTADQRRVVLSGFGTEDTHHTIHTLKWGPDGRLYFNQSIYIHSHVETPYGMVRLNSGGIFAYDPRTERTEVIAKGWCNPWGHVWDEWGQQFVTDGAGSQGISWLVPGAMYFTYENGRKIMPSITPGGNPKFCGLELVRSPLFPADWQGHALTCDFRAHRIVRFEIKDLSEPLKDGKDTKDRKDTKDASLLSPESLSSLKSGYEARQMPDLVRTTDSSFRPIDIKHGPDGALYVADWTNPVINHGEVDFRDPRRDKVNGRIWRIAPKGSTPIKWESLVGKTATEVMVQPIKHEAPFAPVMRGAWFEEQQLRIVAAKGWNEVIEQQIKAKKDKEEYLKASSKAQPNKDGSITISDVAPTMTLSGRLNVGEDKFYHAHDWMDLRKMFAGLAVGQAKQAFFWFQKYDTPRALAVAIRIEAMLIATPGSTVAPPTLQSDGSWRAAEIIRRPLSHQISSNFKFGAKHSHPRVRLEAMRALSLIPTVESAALVLEAAVNTPKDDPHYAYAAWLSVNDLAPQVTLWVEANAAGSPSAPPKPSKGEKANPAKPTPEEKSTEAIKEALKSTIIPRIDFNNVTVREAIEFLAKKTKEVRGEKGGINIVLKVDKMPGKPAVDSVAGIPGLEPLETASGDARITLNLNNVPVLEALKYVTTLAGLKFKIDPDGVSIVSHGGPVDMETREWRVRPDFPSGMGATLTAKEALINSGITFPPGSLAIYVKSSSMLTVKNTQENLDLIDILSGNQLADTQSPSKPIDRDAMLTFALQSLPTNQTGPLLSKLVAKNGVPVEGPWIELIGASGGPAECEKLLEYVRAMHPGGPRAAAALVAAARRGVKPPGASLEIIKLAPDEVRADAIRLAGLWKLDAVDFIGANITGASPQILDAAFEALATLRTPAAATVLETLLAAGEFRRRALTALAAFKPDAALAALSSVAQEGDEAAQLALFRALFQSEPFKAKFAKAVPADLPKPAANAALRAARELGRKGQPLVTALASFADAPAPAENAQDITALVADTKKSGNPVEGEVIYRRAALACTACHAIGGAGGKVGPDMTTIGASAPLDYLVESLLVPNAKVKEGYHAIALSLKGGRAASGVLLRETPDAVILRDAAGTESSVPKADITARENLGSIMPAGLLNTLTGREKAHVFAFLSQLGKPGPFDATKSNIARVWWLHPGKDEQAVVSGKAPTPGAKTLTYVDGRLPKAALAEALQMVPESGESVLAVAKFSASGKTRLNLQGVTKAWLDGAPLAIASNPSPEVELTAGDHTLVVKLETKQLPEVLRADCSEGRFVTE